MRVWMFAYMGGGGTCMVHVGGECAMYDLGVCMRVCVYVCIYVYVCTCVYVYVGVCVCGLCVCIYTRSAYLSHESTSICLLAVSECLLFRNSIQLILAQWS